MSERVEAWAKVAGALAASGVFLYIVGVGVVWQRLRTAGLPEEEGLSVIPKDQVALAGVEELLISLGMAALLVGLPLLLLKVAKRHVEDPETSETPVERGFVGRPGLWLGVGILIAALLVPWSWPGVISVIVVALALAVGLRFFGLNRSGRGGEMSYLWLVGTVALAVLVLSLERQREFPSSFSPVTVVLAKGKPVMGLYVGSSSDSVVVGQRRVDRAREIQAAARDPLPGELQPTNAEIRAAKRCTTETRRCKVTPRLIVIERGEVKRLRLREADDILPEANSLFGRVIGDDVSCLLPECRFGDERRSVFAIPLP